MFPNRELPWKEVSQNTSTPTPNTWYGTGMKKNEQLSILKELEKSTAWKLIQDYIQKSIVDAAMQMADGTPMPEAQYQFHRGAMWAAKRHLTLVPSLIAQLENDLLLEMDPATAGKIVEQSALRPGNTKEKLNGKATSN